MALRFLTKGLKALTAGGAGAGLTGGLMSMAEKFSSDDQIETPEVSETEGGQQQKKQERPIPVETFSTTTPEALSGFAAHVQKEVKNSERIHQQQSFQITNLTPIQQEQAPSMVAIRGIGSAAGVLEDKAKDDIDKKRKAKLKADREEEERKLEGDDTTSNVFEKVGEYGNNLKNGVLGALSNFVAPALLFGGSYVADKLGIGEGTNIETIVDTIDEGLDRLGQVGAMSGIRNVASKALRGAGRAAGFVSDVGLGGARASTMSTQAATIVAGKVNPRAAKFGPMLSKIRSARAFFLKLSRTTSGITSKFASFIAGMPSGLRKFLQRAAKKAVKWILIIEAIDLIYNSTQAFILGSISKEEWHKRNKEQIYRIIRLFGAPVLGMMILGLAGSPVPVLGNVAGGLAGFIIGMILGETMFYVLNMEALSNGIYDLIFQQKFSTLISYAPALIKRITVEIPKILAEATIEAAKGMANVATAAFSDIVDTTGRMATSEEITSKYGEDISQEEILMKAGEGIGTDENAILYAFKDIDTPEKYNAFKTKFEEDFMPEYNKGFGRDVDSMEEYLQKELNVTQFDKLKNQVATQMRENKQNDSEKLKDFLRESGIDESTVISGIGAVSDEEFAKYQSGELIDVTTQDGERVLMTEQQLRDSDQVGIAARESAMSRIERNRRIAIRRQTSVEESPVSVETSQTTQQPESPTQGSQDQPTPVKTREAVADTNENIQQNIIPAVNNMNNSINLVTQNVMAQQQRKSPPAGTEGPSIPSSANPSRRTTDNFIDVGYVT